MFVSILTIWRGNALSHKLEVGDGVPFCVPLHFNYLVSALHQGAPNLAGRSTALAPPWFRPGSALPIALLWFLFYFDSETISGVGGLCFEDDDLKRGRQLFLKKKVHPSENPGYASNSGWPGWGFSDLEMTWFHYFSGAATVTTDLDIKYITLRMPSVSRGSGNEGPCVRRQVRKSFARCQIINHSPRVRRKLVLTFHKLLPTTWLNNVSELRLTIL